MSSSSSSPLGKLIRLKLVERDMTRKDLAGKLGVRETTISGWITGTHKPENKYLPALAECLGVSEYDLLKTFVSAGAVGEIAGLQAKLDQQRSQILAQAALLDDLQQEIAALTEVIAGLRATAHEAGWPAREREYKRRVAELEQQLAQARPVPNP